MDMHPRIKSAKHVNGYKVELAFTDGTIATVDFQDRISGRGGVFAPLQNVEFFKQVSVDHEAGTVVWPNGVDFCPDVLYSDAIGTPLQLAANEIVR
jgi:hypothetical protein